MQLDALGRNFPKPKPCPGPCLPLFVDNRNAVAAVAGDKNRFIVIKDIQGKTVTIWVDSPPKEFDKVLPEVQKVLDSVEWKTAS
ncbi:MAG: hypothetical protein ACR2GU_07895 [Rubrobacteraceae bacterium]